VVQTPSWGYFKGKSPNKFENGEILSDNELEDPTHAFTLNTHLYMTSLRSLRPFVGPNPGVQPPSWGYFKGKSPNKFENGDILVNNELEDPLHAFTLNTHLYMTSLRSLRPLLGSN